MVWSRRTMCILALVMTLLVCLGGLAVVAYTAPPREHGRLAGIFIETDAGYARIPRRALDCALVEASARRESCWTTVDGQQLRVDVAHRAPEAFGFEACSATFGTTTATCRPGRITTVNGGAFNYALVHGAALGVRDEEFDGLRRRHRLENLDEAGWLTLGQRWSALLALGVVAAILVAPRWRLPIRLAVALGAGLGTFAAAGLASVVLLLLTGRAD